MKKIFRKQLICSITSILLLLGLLGGKVLPETETDPNAGIQTMGYSGPGSSTDYLKPNPTDSDGDLD